MLTTDAPGGTFSAASNLGGSPSVFLDVLGQGESFCHESFSAFVEVVIVVFVLYCVSIYHTDFRVFPGVLNV